MKRKHKICQNDISSALHAFLNRGGHIIHLPDQQYRASTLVEGEKYDDYEDIRNLSTLDGKEDLPA